MKKGSCIFSLVVFLTVAAISSLPAQYFGTGSIFSKGVGARQMSLGGAVTAYPKDPTTIFWNPAGLEYLSRQSATLFYASFLAGTSYNFAGCAYPTLNLGTFGFGLSRIATGDIPRRGFTYRSDGGFDYNQTEFYLSYAKVIRNLISVGVNFKLERIVLDNSSDTGFGADLALLYQPDFDFVLLQDLRVGLTIQNIYSPRLKPGDATDFIPHRFLLGLAKSFNLGADQKPLVWLFSIDKDDQETLTAHTGLEYSYRDLGLLRLGYNNDGLTFGAGACYRQFQLDYAYASLAKGDFDASQRVSFTVQFGKNREELLEFANEKRRIEIEQQVSLQQEKERKETIKRFLKEGREYYNNTNYFDAIIKFSQVLEVDRGNPEAEEMLAESNARIRETRQQEMNEQLAKIQEDTERRRTEEYVNKHVDLGQTYLSQGKYDEAVGEFKLALDRLPDNQNIKELIEKARTELGNRVNILIRRADDLARKGNYSDAIQILNEAQLLTQNDELKMEEITNRISQLETRLNVYDFYQQGLISYKAESWADAMKNFEKAMKLDPNNKDIAHFYQEAKRRAQAREEEMTPEMQKRFIQAFNLYIEDHIQEALDIWEDLLQIQPYNKRIIESIDKARKQLEKQQKAKK